jgi:putative peptidoglycan lipid II flippase
MKKVLAWIVSPVYTSEIAAGFFALCSLATTFVGIFRERLLATMVGPGPILDAYIVGHKIPDFLYATTAAMVSVTILLPFVAKYSESNTEGERFSEIVTVYSIFSVAISGILIIVAPGLVQLIAPGVSVETYTHAVSMTRMLLISPILMGLSNIFVSISQLQKRFIATALAPLIYNIITLVGMFFLYPRMGPIGLPIAIVFAALSHMILTLFASLQGEMTFGFVSRVSWKRMVQLIVVAIPRTFSVSMSVVSSIVVVYFISKLPSGALSLYNMAIVIQNVPVTLVGISLATAIFPSLVSAFSENNQVAFSNHAAKTVRLIVFAGIPCAAVLFLVDNQVVSILFGGGKFTGEYITQTAKLVSLFALGILAQCFIQLTARMYYARNETWKPFRQGAIGLTTTVFAIITLQYLVSLTLEDIVLCLVLGWAVNAIIGVGGVLPRVLIRRDLRGIIRFVLIAILANLCGGMFTYGVGAAMQQFGQGSTVDMIIYICVVGLVYCIIALSILALFNVQEIQVLQVYMKSKLMGSKK